MSKATQHCPFMYFGLEPSIEIDLAVLNQRYYALQRATHPDHFTMHSVAEKNAAALKSSEINRAYECLKHPLKRLWAFLEAHGEAEQQESTIQDNPLLISKVFELQEQAHDLTSEAEQSEFIAQLYHLMDQEKHLFATWVAHKDFEKAVLSLHWLTYLHKLCADTQARQFSEGKA